MNDVSDPEWQAGYETITYPYQGNAGFGKAVDSAKGQFGKISILRMFQGWAGTTVVYKKVS